MSFAPYTEEDKLDRFINGFSTQSFRDQADRDYIAARLACRYELFPQFLWASHQAIEKYLKAILLYNRVTAKNVRHDLSKALSLTERLPFKIELSPQSRKFIAHLADVGEFRYIDIPFHVNGHVFVDLDRAVWEIRRYCQVLNVFGKALPLEEQRLLDDALSELDRSAYEPAHEFKLQGGLLEKILAEKKYPSRSALTWNNAFFGLRKRTTVKAMSHLSEQNPLLHLYPEMLDELVKYVFIPDKLQDAYRQHLADIKAGVKARP